MRRTVWLSAMLGCALLSGCELIADFDRSKIPRPDAGSSPMNDAEVMDDASLPDASPPDEDAGSDEDAGF